MLRCLYFKYINRTFCWGFLGLDQCIVSVCLISNGDYLSCGFQFDCNTFLIVLKTRGLVEYRNQRDSGWQDWATFGLVAPYIKKTHITVGWQVNNLPIKTQIVSWNNSICNNFVYFVSVLISYERQIILLQVKCWWLVNIQKIIWQENKFSSSAWVLRKTISTWKLIIYSICCCCSDLC